MSTNWEEKYSSLKGSVEDLYYSAYWEPDRPVDSRSLWEKVRDAAGLVPGKSPTKISNGDVAMDIEKVVSALKPKPGVMSTELWFIGIATTAAQYLANAESSGDPLVDAVKHLVAGAIVIVGITSYVKMRAQQKTASMEATKQVISEIAKNGKQ